MKKIILSLTMASSFMFGANNLLTIVEQNSLTKMGKHSLKSPIDPSKSISIESGIENSVFHNYGPYAFTDIDNSYQKDLNVVVMIGEKTIQYGSIYSKGFGEKYNINTLINLLKKQDYALALNTLDAFKKDNVIFIRNRFANVTKQNFVALENYIKANVSTERQFSYLKKLETIYLIIDYANNIHSYTIGNLDLDPINNVFFDIKGALKSPRTLSSTRPAYPQKWVMGGEYDDGHYVNDYENYNGETTTTSTKKEYEVVNGTFIKRCQVPVLFSGYDDYESYSNIDYVYYDIKDVLSIDLSKPLSITELYMLTHDICPRVEQSGKKRWNRNRLKIVYPSIPSASGQREWATNALKQNRNQGVHMNKMKNYYAGIQNAISNNLKEFNDIGVVDGKLMHVSYNLSESIVNEKVVQGVVKMATTGIMFRDRVRVISSEGIDYNVKNLPQPEVATYSELTKDDTTGGKFGTTYYFYNTKLQSGSPLYDDAHLHSSITPSNSKTSNFIQSKNGEKVEGVEVLWITNNGGTPIQPYLYYNNNEDINGSSSVSSSDLLENVSGYLRSDVDIWGNGDVYPVNVKTIKTESFPINTKQDATRYFGPIFNNKVFLDKHIKSINKEVPLNCEIETCTEAQRLEANPTKTITETIEKLYCGASFTNPDIQNFSFELLQDVQNRFIEKPFGDILYHYHKAPIEEVIQTYNSTQKVPTFYQYVGEVANEQECLETLNSVSIKSIKDVLIEENAINFKFKLKSIVSELGEEEQGAYVGSEELVYSFATDILNNHTIVYENQTIDKDGIFNTWNNYEDVESGTFYKFYKNLEKSAQKISDDDEISQILVP